MYCIEHDGKEYYIGTKEHFEDYLREVCGEEAFEAYNDLIGGNNAEIENLKEELDDTEYARDRYEKIADKHYNQLNEVYRLCQDFREEVGDKSLRLNRKRIIDWIDTIERESQE